VSEPDQIVSAPEGLRPVRWGLGDAVAGWFIAQAGGAIAFSLVVLLSGIDVDDTDDLSLGWIAVAQLGLWFGFIGVPWFAARIKGNGLVHDFAVRGERWDSLRGLGVGVGSQLVLLPLLYIPIYVLFDKTQDDVSQVARDLTDRATDPIGVILLVLIVGIGAPIAEEIFYRGLLYRSMENRFGTWPAIVGSGVVFGASHFQPITFVGLTAFGVVLAYLTHRTGRLAPAIFAHMAFNMVTVILMVTD
jgi:uncharacterized protein